jgi:hypothetical protein
MSIAQFDPPIVSSGELVPTLRQRGFAVAAPAWTAAISGSPGDHLLALAAEWNDMPPDAYLRDGGHYRRRRHGSFIVDQRSCHPVPHRAHYQPPVYNALHGGIERWFEPLRPSLIESPAWSALLVGAAACFSALSAGERWFVEAHQFRIDASGGVGRPTPEGAHRDGVDFIALFLVARTQVRGGETRVFEAQGPTGVRFTLSTPWTALLLDDARVIHETTPIQPVAEQQAEEGISYRDTLVLTFRRSGFQEP